MQRHTWALEGLAWGKWQLRLVFPWIVFKEVSDCVQTKYVIKRQIYS